MLEQVSKPIIPIRVVDDPSKKLVCAFNDFDPFIKFGRDNQLFVKREYIEKYAQYLLTKTLGWKMWRGTQRIRLRI